MFNRISLLLAASLIILAGCDSAGKDTKTAIKPAVAVECAVVTPSRFTEGIEVTGTLEPKFSVDVKTQIPGLVRQVYVNEWVRVKKGQQLLRIDLSETEAQVKRAEAGVAAAKAGLSQMRVAQMRADRELSRILKLKDSGLATQQAVDDTRTEYEAAQARIESARAQLGVAEEDLRQSRSRLSKGVVTAPMDGVVALKEVNVGDLTSDAAAAKPVFRIVDNRLLNLTVTLSSSDSARVTVGQELAFTVDSLPDKTFLGKVMYVNPELSVADRSLKVIAEVRNVPEILKGGLFAKGRIVTGKRDAVILVHRSALLAWDTTAKTATVCIIQGDKAGLRPVKTGSINGDQVEIVSGLASGEHYVIRGGFNLKDGDSVVIGGAKP